MKIFTNVTNGIRPRQKEYIKALNCIAGEDKEILADVADNNVLTARRLIAEHTTYPVTVYKSYGKDKPLTFEGSDEAEEYVEHCPGLDYYLKKQALTEDADTGLFIFDGENDDVFTDILSMVIQGKTSVVIMSKTGESHVVKNIDELKALIGWRSKSHVYMDGYVPKEKYDPAIRACVPSKDMADHLIQNPVPKKQLIEIIVNAPVDIYIKMLFCRNMMSTDGILSELADEAVNVMKGRTCRDGLLAYKLYQKVRENTFTYYYDELQRAINSLVYVDELRDVFLTGAVELDEYEGDSYNRNKKFDIKKDEKTPVRSREGLERYMFRDDYYTERWGFGCSTYWYEAEKWCNSGDGEMNMSYIYTVTIDDAKEKDFLEQKPGRTPAVVMFFDKSVYKQRLVVDSETNDERLPSLFYRGKCMTPLPIPFMPGDVLEIDCLPFLDKIRVVLLEVNDDPCGSVILYTNEDDLWERGILDRDFGFGFYRPRLSCYYRLKKYEEKPVSEKERKSWSYIVDIDSPKKKEMMKMVSEYIGHDPVKGSRMAGMMFEVKKAGLTDEELKSLLGGDAK